MHIRKHHEHIIDCETSRAKSYHCHPVSSVAQGRRQWTDCARYARRWPTSTVGSAGVFRRGGGGGGGVLQSSSKAEWFRWRDARVGWRFRWRMDLTRITKDTSLFTADMLLTFHHFSHPTKSVRLKSKSCQTFSNILTHKVQ